MREIKFRVWDTKGKQMLTGFSLFGETILLGAIHDWQHEIYPSAGDSLERLNDLVEMQYTGLKDKNGVDIYEGDILVNSRGKLPGVVSFKYGSFMWQDDFLGYDWEDDQLEINLPETWATIIGNIYQNPELTNPAKTI